MATREERGQLLRVATEVMTLGGDGPDERRRLARERHPHFAYENPLLFEVLVKDGAAFDIANLTYMLSQLDAVQQGHVSNVDAENNVSERLRTTPAPPDDGL